MRLFGRAYFNEIKKEETILKIIHRHWFDIFQQFIIVFVIAIALISGLVIVPFYFPDLRDGNNFPFLVFLETTFALIIWVYAFLIWIDYYFDMWIVTSDRVVNIEQKGLFLRQVSELKFAKIQDVTADVKGFFPTILNYGDVHIQTAGEEGKFLFRQVPDPYGLKNLIMDIQKHHETERENKIGDLISKMKE